MALRELLLPWDRQPQEAVGIDWTSPLTNGLVSLLADNSDGTRSYIGALSAGGDANGAPRTVRGSVIGPAYRGSSHLDWHAGPDIGLASQTAITVVALVIRTGSGSAAYSGPFGVGDSTPTIALEANPDDYSGTGVFFSAWSSAGARSNLYLGSAKLAPLDTPQVVAIRVSGSTISAFYGGRLLGSAAGPAVLRTFGALNKGRSQGIRFNGLVPFAACWARALTDSEIAEIGANPWQLLEPRRLYIPGAAAGGGPQSESGGASTTVTVTAAGAGSAAEVATGGASASCSVTAAGVGTAAEQAGGGSSASATTSATGAGTALEYTSGGASASVIVTAVGSGAGSSADSGGASAVVTVSAAGAGSALESASGGASAAVIVTAAGDGAGADGQAGGASAAVTISAAGAGTATEQASGGAGASVLVTAAGVGLALEIAAGGSSAGVLVSALGGGTDGALSDDEIYPLAGLTQSLPISGAQALPLAGQRQTYPLG